MKAAGQRAAQDPLFPVFALPLWSCQNGQGVRLQERELFGRGGTFSAEVEGTCALTSWFPAMKHH